MKHIFLIFLALVSLPAFAQPREIQGQLNEALTLGVGDTAVIGDLKVTLISVQDDGCGTKRECYWSQYRDATFHVWQGDNDLGEITLSRASREDSKMSVQVGEWFIILGGVDGYEVEMPTASFKITDTALGYTY